MTVKKILFVIFLFLIAVFANGQGQAQKIIYPKVKIRLGAGISIIDFYGKQPFLTFLCIEGCLPSNQKTVPNFTFGGQITFQLKQQHYIGVGYRWYQLKLEQGIYDLFNQNTYQNNTELSYHSFTLIHQYQLNEAKKYLWWNNAIGIDKTNGKGLFKTWAIFYKTSLSFQLKYHKNRGVALQPFFQIGISPYTEKRVEEYGVMRPIMLGLTIDIPYDVYQ